MKRNEIAALAVMEANKQGSMHFFTFTYNNRTLPLRPTGPGFDSSDIIRGFECSQRFLDCFDDGCKPVEFGSPNLFVTPSLFREDLRKFIKRVRVRYLRAFGVHLPWRYLAFGEYGSRSSRPHYHLLAFGLTDSQARFIADAWSKDFGFSQVKQIPAFNKDGSSGFACAAVYVAKYISKGDFVPQFVRDGYAEKPRRISSVRFGYPSAVELDRMKDFFSQGIFEDPVPILERERLSLANESFWLIANPSPFRVEFKN